MAWDITTASEEWPRDYTDRMEAENGILGGLNEGTHVIKLSEKIAVKYGHNVTAAEARTQEFAFSQVDHNIVRVPQVHRYFSVKTKHRQRPRGYLFMDYIPGRTLDDLDLDIHTDVIARIANIIAHLGSICNGDQPPGPVGGGNHEAISGRILAVGLRSSPPNI